MLIVPAHPFKKAIKIWMSGNLLPFTLKPFIIHFQSSHQLSMWWWDTKTSLIKHVPSHQRLTQIRSLLHALLEKDGLTAILENILHYEKRLRHLWMSSIKSCSCYSQRTESWHSYIPNMRICAAWFWDLVMIMVIEWDQSGFRFLNEGCVTL